ncbi:MAG: glycoside hydrolase family 9 protein [Bryobacteraceae bacterium]
MERREFLQGLALAATATALQAQEGPPKPEPVETMTAGPEPAIAVCHVGFRPEANKRIVARNTNAPGVFSMYDISSGPAFRIERPLKPMHSDFAPALVGDFSDVRRPGLYQIRVGNEISPPFFIRPDAWRRYLPVVVSYHRAQRCGVAVPNVHAVCHLDDARRRDNDRHVDEVGGWHDAGDVRKWMDATMMNAFGLLAIAKHLGESWDLAGSGLAPLHEEVRWGNTYFLKMQDTDGRVWADVAGGVNGDNSDNHWTDNRIGTADDRYLNPAKPGLVQAMFTALQAKYASEFAARDRTYSERCLTAAKRCWGANTRAGDTVQSGWWTLAAIALHHATGDDEVLRAAQQLAMDLASLQHSRGFWPMARGSSEPYKHAVHGALPPFALLEAARVFPDSSDAPQWRQAARRYIDEYAIPMCERSAYGFMPFGLFHGSPTPERYRPVSGNLTYRFFMPVRKQFWWQGLNAHLASHALLFATAATDLHQPAYRGLAYRQLEWIFGTNPFGATLASGIGVRNPYPHSRYVGVIPGGIMNGICGNADDRPILDTSFGFSWRTNEYWSPHVGYFEWAQAVLEQA